MQPIVALFVEAVKSQAPVVMGMISAALVAGATALVVLAKKVAKTGRAIVEAKLAVMEAEAERERLAALAAVRIVEAKTEPQMRLDSPVKKEMATALAEDLLGKHVPNMPEVVEAAHAVDKARHSGAPDVITEPEMPAVKRDAR